MPAENRPSRTRTAGSSGGPF